MPAGSEPEPEPELEPGLPNRPRIDQLEPEPEVVPGQAEMFAGVQVETVVSHPHLILIILILSSPHPHPHLVTGKSDGCQRDVSDAWG